MDQLEEVDVSAKKVVRMAVILSTVLAFFAFIVVLVSTHWVWGLSFIAFGVVFIVSLVAIAMLNLGSKPNPPHLG